jgi:hypothetical protein
MNVTPTAGIAAAWSAAKANPGAQAAQTASAQAQKAGTAEETRPEPKKGPPPAEGQGTRVDVQV